MNTMILRNHRVRFASVDGEKYYHLIDICDALSLYVGLELKATIQIKSILALITIV